MRHDTARLRPHGVCFVFCALVLHGSVFSFDILVFLM
jgi:hypothetical protein